jgi:hypothetical protein
VSKDFDIARLYSRQSITNQLLDDYGYREWDPTWVIDRDFDNTADLSKSIAQVWE